MKITLTLAAAISIALLSGCSAIQQGHLYSSGTVPTAASVAQAGGEQVYRQTLYTGADFKADGSARGFSEYNFVTESSPCTVLGDGYKGLTFNSISMFYEVEKGSDKYTFNCRAVQNGPSPAMRLFLIGSSADCSARTGNSSQFGVISAFAKQIDQKCSGYRISGGKATNVDKTYPQS